MNTRSKARLAVWLLGAVGVAALVKSRHDPATCRYCQAPAQLREVEAAVTSLRGEIAQYRAQVGQVYADELAADERARTVLADREQQRESWLRELGTWERRMDVLEARVWNAATNPAAAPPAVSERRGLGDQAPAAFFPKNDAPS